MFLQHMLWVLDSIMAESTPPATDILKEGFLTKQGRRSAIVVMVICELFVCIDLRT